MLLRLFLRNCNCKHSNNKSVTYSFWGMIKGISLCFLLYFSATTLHAKEALIQCTSSSIPKGSLVALVVFDNLLSQHEKAIAKTETADNGSFSLKTPSLRQTYYAQIRYGQHYADFYLIPGNSYQCIWPIFAVENSKARPYHNIVIRTLEIKEETPKPYNDWIKKFNLVYDTFLSKEGANLLVRGRAINSIKQFRQQAYLSGGDLLDADFRTEIDYRLALLEMSANFSKSYLYKAFIQNRPILHYHSAYMDFFHQFYEKYIDNKIFTQQMQPFLINLKKGKAYLSLLDDVKRLPFMENDTLRKMVLVKNLTTLHNLKGIPKASILSLLKQISSEEQVDVVREAAQHALTHLTALQPGTQAPNFEAKAIDGGSVSLDQLKGSFLLIEFNDLSCTSCLSETLILKEYKKKYGAKIRFVTVLLNANPKSMEQWAAASMFDWTVLAVRKEDEAIKKYELVSVPQYLLLHPDGRIYNAPRLKPSEGLEKYLIEIKNKW